MPTASIVSAATAVDVTAAYVVRHAFPWQGRMIQSGDEVSAKTFATGGDPTGARKLQQLFGAHVLFAKHDSRAQKAREARVGPPAETGTNGRADPASAPGAPTALPERPTAEQIESMTRTELLDHAEHAGIEKPHSARSIDLRSGLLSHYGHV